MATSAYAGTNTSAYGGPISGIWAGSPALRSRQKMFSPCTPSFGKAAGMAIRNPFKAATIWKS